MGYYIKHIISIDKDSTKEKLKELQQIIEDLSDFTFKLYDDHLDDSNWNSGDGVSHLDDCYIWERVSEKFGEIDFTVHCVSEDNAIYDYYCYNGFASLVTLRETDQWYSYYQGEDSNLRSPGANKGYYDDPGYGEDYEFKYGDKTIPAGVEWWLNNDDNQ